MKITQTSVDELRKLGEVLASTNDYNMKIVVLVSIHSRLKAYYKIQEDVGTSTYRYLDDFIQNIIEALEHKEFYIAFVYTERLIHHHRPPIGEVKGYELGDISQFV